MQPGSGVAECEEDLVLVPWLAEYLLDRDAIVYEDGSELMLGAEFNVRIAGLNAEYRERFESHGLWVSNTGENVPTDSD